ncbi:MAG: pentapeptide repeat-containing protein, partial [Anaerolineaceae bacterium]
HCDLTGADFCNAKLKGADFRTALLNGLRVGAQDFAGAIIAPEQALQVVGLLGVEVKEPDDPLNII